MAVIAYGVLPAPAAPPPTPWQGLDMTWAGADGSEWSLTDPSSGSVMLPGVRGWSMPPVTHYNDTYASVHGSRWRGYNVGEREVFWPIQIYSDISSQDWVTRDSKFWATMHPAHPGVWMVRQPDGTKRRLTLRFHDDGTQAFDTDPILSGWCSYGITFHAEQPFWEGDPIAKPFSSGTGGDFFGGTGGPPFVISPGNAIATAELTNPGDEPAWPVWVLDGPFTAFTLTVDGQSIASSTITATAGQQLVITTEPTQRSALLDGTDVMGSLSSYGFTALPDGGQVPLSLAYTGTGGITCQFTPLYHRAW